MFSFQSIFINFPRLRCSTQHSLGGGRGSLCCGMQPWDLIVNYVFYLGNTNITSQLNPERLDINSKIDVH